MGAPITRVDRKAFKEAFIKAVAKVADVYVDSMFEDVDAEVKNGSREGAYHIVVKNAVRMLAYMSRPREVLGTFFNNDGAYDTCDESVEPLIDAMEELVKQA